MNSQAEEALPLSTDVRSDGNKLVTLRGIAGNDAQRRQQLALKEKDRKLPPGPKYSLKSSKGQVSFVFEIGKNVLAKFSKSFPEVSHKESFIVGSVTVAGILQLWDLTSRRVIVEEDTHLQTVNWAQMVLGDDQEVRTFVHSRTLGLYAYKSFPLVLSAQFSQGIHPGFCHTVFCRSNDFLVYPSTTDDSAKNVCRVLSFDLNEKYTFPSVAPLTCLTTGVLTEPAVCLVACGSEDGNVTVIDSSKCSIVSQFKIGDEKSTRKDGNVDIPFCIDCHGKMLVVGTSGTHLYFFNKLPSLEIDGLTQLKLTNEGTTFVKFRNDGQILVTAGADKLLRFFSIPKLTPLAILNFHSDSITALNFALDVQRNYYLLLSCSQDLTIAVWDIFNKPALQMLI